MRTIFYPTITQNLNFAMKNMMLKGILPLSLLALLLSACEPWGVRGDGPLVDETRNLEDFDRVHVSIPGKVKLVIDTVFKVDIQIEESLAPYLETEVRNGRLDIYFSRNTRDVDDLEVTVHMPALEEISLSGSGDIDANDTLEGQKLRLDVSGSGSIDLNAALFNEIHTNVSGSGDIDVSGLADHLEAHVSGSGKVDALDCPVKTAEVHISGSGQVYCRVSDELKARISGSGTVWYEGSPQLDVSVSGSGKVVKR
jgi:hypothetical protein